MKLSSPFFSFLPFFRASDILYHLRNLLHADFSLETCPYFAVLQYNHSRYSRYTIPLRKLCVRVNVDAVGRYSRFVCIGICVKLRCKCTARCTPWCVKIKQYSPFLTFCKYLSEMGGSGLK